MTPHTSGPRHAAPEPPRRHLTLVTGPVALPPHPPVAEPATAPLPIPQTREPVRVRRPGGHLVAVPPAPPVVRPTGLAMKRRNPVGAWIGLPLITLGVYHLVWYYKIHRELADFDRRRAVPVAGPMLVLLLLGVITLGIAPLISYHNTGNRIATAQRAAGLQPTCSAVTGLLLCFVGFQALYYQSELNRIVDAYGAREGTPVTLAA